MILKQIKKTILIYFILISTFLLAPFIVFGASRIPKTPTNIKGILCIIAFLALNFVPYIMVLAFGAFLLGLIKYVGSGDNEEKRGEGTKMMVYGIVGLFFMVSIWGILKIFVSSFALNIGTPQFKEDSYGSGYGAGCAASSSGEADGFGFHN